MNKCIDCKNCMYTDSEILTSTTVWTFSIFYPYNRVDFVTNKGNPFYYCSVLYEIEIERDDYVGVRVLPSDGCTMKFKMKEK